MTSQPILVGTSAVQPPAPARPGYAFAGWISDFTLGQLQLFHAGQRQPCVVCGVDR
ncbi:MAG: InlB B-repeat-containing protein, partial [Betaproteobacteria bacterium]|nr:InlB B-repeat-containing protein [Betaproteobacteria bacterium]